MESACLFDAWLHENTGYTYHGDAPITGLTRFELDKLQLGWLVRQEQEADAAGWDGGYGSYSDRRKSSHQQDITRRLRQMEVERN